uniref:Conotoxin n=1 Tax=Conus andremenezi TaxID=1077466 RepID=A0A291C1R9_9COND|nr:conotoxin [Conus andremenezi]
MTICLLLFPLTALPLDGDQPADQPVERMLDISPELNAWFDPVKRCCTLSLCHVCSPCCS